MGLLSVIATLLCLVGIGCGVVALATTSWVTPGVGLFQNCFTFLIQTCSVTIGDDAISLIVACLICLGLFISLPAVVLLFVDILKTNKKKVMTAGALLLIGGILIGSGATTYTILRRPDQLDSILSMKFGYSFYMAWGSCAAIILSGIIAFIAGSPSRF